MRTQSHPKPNCHSYLLGRNACGRWVVQVSDGTSGGVFTDRRQALHFALYEQDGTSSVIETARPLELKVLE